MRLNGGHSSSRIQCSSCGASTEAACGCGVKYVPSVALVAAYDRENPGKSTRQAGTALGLSKSAVHKARKKAGVHSWTPDDRVSGEDGKSYPARQQKEELEAGTPDSTGGMFFLRIEQASLLATYDEEELRLLKKYKARRDLVVSIRKAADKLTQLANQLER